MLIFIFVVYYLLYFYLFVVVVLKELFTITIREKHRLLEGIIFARNDCIRAWAMLLNVVIFPLQVLLLITFAAASAAQDEANNFANYGHAAAAAGWVIFVGVFGFIYEFFFLVCRLLNLAFMGVYRTIVIVVVSWYMSGSSVVQYQCFLYFCCLGK